LSLAVSFGLNKYVEAKLNEDRYVLSAKRCRPLLDYIIFSQCPVDTEMVSLLLQNSADPNKEFCGSSIWQYALELIELLVSKLKIPKRGGGFKIVTAPAHKEWSRIFKLLVHAGAHPNILCMHIKNMRDHKEMPQYIARFSTPSKIFLPGGIFPDAGLVETIKSHGGIEFFESIQLQSTDWDDALVEALKVKAAVVQRFQTILRLQTSEGNLLCSTNLGGHAGRPNTEQTGSAHKLVDPIQPELAPKSTLKTQIANLWTFTMVKRLSRH
jgi:hypothetical protein